MCASAKVYLASDIYSRVNRYKDLPLNDSTITAAAAYANYIVATIVLRVLRQPDVNPSSSSSDSNSNANQQP